MGSDAKDVRARENTNVAIYKEKVDTQECGSFRGEADVTYGLLGPTVMH